MPPPTRATGKPRDLLPREQVVNGEPSYEHEPSETQRQDLSSTDSQPPHHASGSAPNKAQRQILSSWAMPAAPRPHKRELAMPPIPAASTRRLPPGLPFPTESSPFYALCSHPDFQAKPGKPSSHAHPEPEPEASSRKRQKYDADHHAHDHSYSSTIPTPGQATGYFGHQARAGIQRATSFQPPQVQDAHMMPTFPVELAVPPQDVESLVRVLQGVPRIMHALHDQHLTALEGLAQKVAMLEAKVEMYEQESTRLKMQLGVAMARRAAEDGKAD